MTLGRTSSGAIKIKTDGGLRAVGCACCGGCGCYSISIPSNLRALFENATSGNVWGYNSNEFLLNPYPDAYWSMDWFFPAPEGAAYNILVETSFRKNGCLYFRGEYFEYTAGFDTGLALYGKPAACVLEITTYVEGTFTINGDGEFSYYYIVDEFGIPYGIPPVPNLVIT